MSLKKIKFSADVIQDGLVRFEAGKVYEVEVETGSFQRWLKRGAQEVVEIEKVKVESKVDAIKEEIVPDVVDVVAPAPKAEGKNKKNKDKFDL